MKRFIKSKKGVALLATLVVVGASAFGAYAYFTNSGANNSNTVVSVGNAGTGFTVQQDENLGGTNGALAAASTGYAEPNAGVTPCTNSAATVTQLLPALTTSCNVVQATVPFTVSNESESATSLSSYTLTIENTTTGGTWFSCGAGGGTISACTDTLPACTAADFEINSGGANDSPVTVSSLGQDLSPLSDAPANSRAYSYTVELVDNTANQDNCENVTPPITVSATS